MKKILFFLALLFSASCVFAQHPIGTDSLPLQTLGSAKTFVKSKNLIGADSGYVNAHYPDTATANFYKVSKYPGGQIMVGDDVWVRNITATAWILVGSGGGSGGTPNLQQVTDVGYTTTNPLISYNSVAVIGADTIDNLNSVSSPSKGVISTNILLSQNPALSWTLPWLSGRTNLFADSSDAKNLQLPNANGFLALSVNGIPADVNGNIIDTSRRTDTAFIIQTIHDSLVLRGPDTTILIFPLYALNDSTFAIKRDSLPRFDYNLANYDTTTWLPLTLITKQYLEDRIGGLGGGGGTYTANGPITLTGSAFGADTSKTAGRLATYSDLTLNTVLTRGNDTRLKINWNDTLTGTLGIITQQITPKDYGTAYSGHGVEDRWQTGMGYFPVANGSGRPNTVWGTGWNYDFGGGRNNSSEASMQFRAESHFESGGDMFEVHWPEITKYDGTLKRLFSMYIKKLTGQNDVTMKVSTFDINRLNLTGATDTTMFSVTPTTMQYNAQDEPTFRIINSRNANNLTITTSATGPTWSIAATTAASARLNFNLPATFKTHATIGTGANTAINIEGVTSGAGAISITNTGAAASSSALQAALLGVYSTSSTVQAVKISNTGNVNTFLSSSGGVAYHMLHTSAANDMFIQQKAETRGRLTFGSGANVAAGDSAIAINGLTNDVKMSHSLAIGPVDAVASARLDVQSTTQGFLPPRMTATQASAISSPAEGLIVYVTNTNGTFLAKGWWGWDGAAWQKLNN